jgi:hypothetical protein
MEIFGSEPKSINTRSDITIGMARKILFKNCYDCPVGKKSVLSGKSILCRELGGTCRGRKTYRWLFDGSTKPEACPYPSGIVIRYCKECPFVEKDWGELVCPKIRERELVRVHKDEIHEDCPLDGIDCDNRSPVV